MKPFMDVVALNMAKAIDLYRLGGVIGLLMGVTTSILLAPARLRARLLAIDAGFLNRQGR
ncbi:MAG: hypothetical protein ABSF25_07425 [Bryobacteraceae bacterium]|jgi:hypothetical protein